MPGIDAGGRFVIQAKGGIYVIGLKTNMGEIPYEDYCEIVAMQHGFDSYAEMQEQGLCILDEKERKQ